MLIARGDMNKWHNVICDTPESAKLINASLPAAHVDWTFASTLHPQLSPAGGFLSVIALHDASPRGCALPLELADTGVAVIDAGLRPRWVDGTDQQIIEGAPARMPRDLSSVLEEDEITWLAAGQRVELASLPPAQLMQLVKAAVAAAAAPTEGVHALALSHE